MAIALLGNNKATASASSTATTASADTSGANLLVVVACMYSRSATSGSATVSDNKSNTWTALSNYVNGNSNICIWYSKNPTVGTGHTFSLNPGGTGYPLIMASWYSGADTTAPQDQANGAGAAAATIQPGSITPSANGCLVVTGVSDNSGTAKTINAPFSPPTDTSTNTSFETGGWAYEIQTTATARNPTWTTTADSGAKAAAIASFKAAAGGGTTTTLTPGVASLTLTKYAPTLSLTVPVPKATLSLTGRAPSLNLTVSVPKATLSLTGRAPSLSLTLPVPKATLSITGKVPVPGISANRTVIPGTASLLLSGKTPAVMATANRWLIPAAAALHFAGKTAAVTVTAPGGTPRRNIYRVDQSGIGGDIYGSGQAGSGKQFRATAGSGKVYR